MSARLKPKYVLLIVFAVLFTVILSLYSTYFAPNIEYGVLSLGSQKLSAGGSTIASIRLTNFGYISGAKTVVMMLDDRIKLTSRVVVPGHATIRVPFNVSSRQPGVHKLKVEGGASIDYRTLSVKETIDREFGTFKPVDYNGVGDQDFNLPVGASSFLLTFTYNGPDNLPISNRLASKHWTAGQKYAIAYGSKFGNVPPGFVGFAVDQVRGKFDNGRGLFASGSTTPYTGTRMFVDSDRPKIQIATDGGWTARIAPVSAAANMSAVTSGKGDAVRLYQNPGDNDYWLIEHDSFIVVTGLSADDYNKIPASNIIYQHTGKASNAVSVKGAPIIVNVMSAGAWSIKVRPDSTEK